MLILESVAAAYYDVMDITCIYTDDTRKHDILVSFALGASLHNRLSLTQPAKLILLRQLIPRTLCSTLQVRYLNLQIALL